MAHAYSMQSSSISSPLFQYPASFASLSGRRQLLAVFIGSSILMFIVLSTMIMCFIDCVHKKTRHNRREKSKNPALMPIDSLPHYSSPALTNGKPISICSSIQKDHFFESNNSSNHHYKSLKSTTTVAALPSSTSHSLSSIDSMTRANTAHNRAIAHTYTYTALSTSEDLTPVDFDDDSHPLPTKNGMEFRMTTV